MLAPIIFENVHCVNRYILVRFKLVFQIFLIFCFDASYLKLLRVLAFSCITNIEIKFIFLRCACTLPILILLPIFVIFLASLVTFHFSGYVQLVCVLFRGLVLYETV